MKKVITFLSQLLENNNKQWFDDHKDNYKEAQAVFNEFILKLISGIGEFDPSVKELQLKDCTYRIYRDVRFSNDKTPYKTHMGAFIAPHGKCGGYSGYYFHIEPQGANYIGGHMLSTGIYLPRPMVLKSIREEIMLSGKPLIDSIVAAKGFKIEWKSALKKVPKNFPAESEYAEYFKLKDWYLHQFLTEDFILSDNLLENTLKEFKKTLAFNEILNRAVDYAVEQSLLS